MSPKPVAEPRRWAAFHCFGVYGLLLDTHASCEDLVGALAAEQLPVARHAARTVVLHVLALRALLAEGLPPDSGDLLGDPFRGIADEDLTAALAAARGVVRAPDVATARVLAQDVERLVRELERDLGYLEKAPSVRRPDGLFPALRLARQLLATNEAAGLPLALPAAWLPRQPDREARR